MKLDGPLADAGAPRRRARWSSRVRPGRGPPPGGGSGASAELPRRSHPGVCVLARPAAQGIARKPGALPATQRGEVQANIARRAGHGRTRAFRAIPRLSRAIRVRASPSRGPARPTDVDDDCGRRRSHREPGPAPHSAASRASASGWPSALAGSPSSLDSSTRPPSALGRRWGLAGHGRASAPDWPSVEFPDSDETTSRTRSRNRQAQRRGAPRKEPPPA